MSSVGPFDVPGWLSFPLTIVWLVTCSNAINLIDGMDGLASGIMVVVAAAFLVLCLIAGGDNGALLSLSAMAFLAAAVCVMLRKYVPRETRAS